MFIIPIGTDAPYYYWPYITVSLIITNTLVFFLGLGGDAFMLQFGMGLHPVQWVTCNFLHADLMHLLGNMIFLWSFGMVVEGKLGWWKYLLLYMTIGIIQAILVQVFMLGYELPPGIPEGAAGALGASSAIFGLMAITLLWAPMNDLKLFVLIFIYPSFIAISIRFFCILHILLAFLGAWMAGFDIGTDMLHLAGGFVGAIFGVLFIKLDWVDCEGWDFFTVMKKDHNSFVALIGEQDQGRDYRRRKKRRRRTRSNNSYSTTTRTQKERDEQKEEDEKLTQQERILRRLRRHLKQDKPSAALIELENLRQIAPKFMLGATDLKTMADAFFRLRDWKKSVQFYQQYTTRFSHKSNNEEEVDEVHLRVAGICVEALNRPKSALKHLKKIDQSYLSDKQLSHYQKIEGRAILLLESQ